MKKNIVVTGTSRGIGLELIKLLSAQGHTVLALSRNKTPFEHPNVLTVATDIGSADDTFVDDYLQKMETVDVLVHNAGAMVNKPFVGLSLADFETVYRTNVFGVALLTQKVLPYMGIGGHIVAISSMGGIQGSMKFPGLAAYSSSKGAVITLMELLAEELKPNGIACNTLALGAVQTEMLQQAFPDYKAPVTAIQMAEYIAEFCLTGQQFYNGKTLEVSSSTP